ncbi:hypothetical protein OEB99_10680 [Actinotalea sp. M2MS4P-6]|uniref:hypothetical protein n=1 Tax=Actinotalea sp. M2MS4P-6 TaxID=2983762 RepID=UPI0021E49B67|nr:hypothetical protein [Actinotalea sp. M2MS4P-6]MCV2394773.1 hypothetical protein [Actinotalea sp. M2MS4P-6]
MSENDTTFGRRVRRSVDPRLLTDDLVLGPVHPGTAVLAPRPVTVLRPQDLLHVRFRFVNLEWGSDHGTVVLQRHDPQHPAGIVMELPSQHIVEQAFLETSVGPAPSSKPAGGVEPELGSEPVFRPVPAVISDGSRVAVSVTDQRVPYSLDGLLTAISTLPLRVAPHAQDHPVRVAGLGTVGSLSDLSRATLDLQHALALRASGSGGSPVSLAAVARGVRAVRTVRGRLGVASAADALVDLDVARELGVRDDLIGRLTGVVAALAQHPTPRAPTDAETSLEIPWRLQLSPSTKNAFAHASQPVEHDGRTELWHSRLGVRDSQDGQVVVDEDDDLGRRVRAIWTRDFGRVSAFTPHPVQAGDFPNADGSADEPALGLDFRKSLNARDRMMIVHSSSNFGLTLNGHTWSPYPVQVDNLMLSALGGWLDSDLQVPTRPDGPISLEEWQHRATLGRDHYVKVVYAGTLFPFGHRASLVKITERRFADDEPDDPAYLYQRFFIVVRQPTRTYTDTSEYTDARDYTGLGSRTVRRDLAMPLGSVHLTTRVTPLLDNPTNLVTTGGLVFFPHAALAPVDFGILATDREGNVAEWSGPLLFVEKDHNSLDGLPEIVKLYWEASDSLRRHPLHGQAIAFARRETPGHPTLDTEQRTSALYFDAAVPPGPGPEGKDDAQYSPMLREAQVVVPAMSALAGAEAPVTVRYPAHYAQHGFAQNRALVYLEVEGAPALDFSQQADRSGGLVTPSLSVTGLSGRTGPIGGSVDAAIAGTTSPADFFGALGAKLFGLVSLADLLDAVGLLPEEFPAFRGEQTNTVLALLDDLRRLAGYVQDLPTRFGGDPDPAVQAALAALNGAATLVGDVLTALTSFDPTDTAQLSADMTALAGQLGGLRDAASAATALPSAVRNDLVGVLGRLAEHLGGAQAVTGVLSLATDLINGIALPSQVSARLDWSHDLPAWPAAAPVFQPVTAAGAAIPHATLDLVVELKPPTGPTAQPTTMVTCSITPFRLQLAGQSWVIALHVEKIEFLVTPGHKPDVNVVLGSQAVEFGGPLTFVDTLRNVIPFDGFSDPPYLDVDASGIKAGFDLDLPPLTVGVMSLANVSLGAQMRVPFIGDSLDFRFNFCTRENPFRLTVWLFGGGGFFAVTVTPMEVTVLEAAFEFGAAVALNFGVASGSIECMAGIYFRIEDDNGQLTGYFRLRGEVDVLGLISASIELYLELSYETSTGKAVGRATLTIEVEICFLSFSVQISCEKKFKGSNADPTFAQVMGPATVGSPRPWDTYCAAFAA